MYNAAYITAAPRPAAAPASVAAERESRTSRAVLRLAVELQSVCSAVLPGDRRIVVLPEKEFNAGVDYYNCRSFRAMCTDDREQRGAEASTPRGEQQEQQASQFAQQGQEEQLGVATLATSTAGHAELERQGEAALSDLNDDWVAEGLAGRQGLESWKVREDYDFDGSLAQRVVDEDCSAFEEFPDDGPSDAGQRQPDVSVTPTPVAKPSGRPPFASSLLLGSMSGSDSDDSDDDGLFSVVDRHGTLHPATSVAAASRIFGDDD